MLNDVQATQRISLQDYERFREYFYRRTGIFFEDSKRYFVDKRLLDRMRLTENTSFRSYFAFMRFQASGEEFQSLVNVMTVNETYFMRERYQFECLVESVLNELVARHGEQKLLRIWSIPSSTGEEPYSIVLSLLEHWPLLERVDVEIVASDIDTQVLQRCREGIYGARSLAHLSPEVRKRYFKPLDDHKWQIADFIRDSVEFTQVNLADLQQTRQYKQFDVIFCRNLLIYFDDLARRKAAEVFYDALDEGGFIFLGHSESMSRISSLFEVRKFPKAMVYQKAEIK